MEFIIYEDDWLQGEGSDNSYLYRVGDGKQCCLGQLAETCGYSLAELLNMRSLQGVFHKRVSPSPALAPLVKLRVIMNTERGPDFYDSDVADTLMVINDAIIDEECGLIGYERMTLDIKKDLLTRHFAEIGIDVSFVPGNRPR